MHHGVRRRPALPAMARRLFRASGRAQLVTALAAGAWLVGCGGSGASGASGGATGMAIGVNLNTLGANYQQIPFVDAFKESGSWQIGDLPAAQGLPTGKTVIGPDGWIQSLASNQHAKACAFSGADGHYPAGRYTLLYDGRGTLVATNTGHVVSGSGGRYVVEVRHPAAGKDWGLCLDERATDPKDPIRNIRLIMPGFEGVYQKDPFYPPFVDLLRPFHTIRFIGWSRANRSDVIEWSDRRTPEYRTQSFSYDKKAPAPEQTGVALEYQIALANKLGADPWLNVPTKASDDFIRKMAELVHTKLRPDLHPIVEFSNEFFNFENAYANAQGRAMGLDADPDPRTNKAAIYWYSVRAARTFDIWNQVWGADHRRIIHVVSGRQSWPRLAQIALDYRGLAKKTDFYAVGGYVYPFKPWAVKDPAVLTAIANGTTEDVLRRMDDFVDGELKQSFAGHAAVAKAEGLRLVVYEGGPDLSLSGVASPSRPDLVKLYLRTREDPRLQQAYEHELEVARRSGVSLFLHFNDVEMPSGWGSYGLVEWQDQPPSDSPLYRALLAQMPPGSLQGRH